MFYTLVYTIYTYMFASDFTNSVTIGCYSILLIGLCHYLKKTLQIETCGVPPSPHFRFFSAELVSF